jgi:hypothetical protein
MNLEFYQQVFEKKLNVKFCYNPSSGNRVFPCRRMDGWHTDMTKLVVHFWNSANAPKKGRLLWNNVFHRQSPRELNFPALKVVLPNERHMFGAAER